MPVFSYSARSRSGEKTEGSIEAADRRSALAQIERMGLVPVTVGESATAKPGSKKKSFLSFESGRAPRMSGRDVLTFSTALSDLLAAGMTLGNALNALAGQKTGRGGDEVIPALRDEIVQGASLSAALAKQPRSFSPFYVNMIRAGEASGQLAEVLKRLVHHYELMQDVKDKVVTALVYPAIVVGLGMITLIVCVWYVIPKFTPIFEELQSTMPLSTRALIGFSNFMLRYGVFVVGAAALLAAAAYKAARTGAGRLWWHGFLLRLPLIKGIVSASIYSGFARTLSTLLTNGVPVLTALDIAEQTTGNAVVAAEIHKARDRVTDGTSMSGPLAAGGVFPQMMTDMLAVGEQTGNVAGSLNHVAARYERQLDRGIKIFTTALEPILILVMAVLVGFVAVSILSAVFSMTSGLDNPA